MTDTQDGNIPLIDGTACGGCSDSYSMEYDEDGSLALARALVRSSSAAADTLPASAGTPLPLKVGVLNGSWYIHLTPQGPHSLVEIRGPMRIEVASPKLRISGDIYVRVPTMSGTPFEVLRPITERPMFFQKNWYPQLSSKEYSWYFRSVGVNYNAGKLVFKFERHLWNSTTQEFIENDSSGKDTGVMELDCRENVFTHPFLPQPTTKLTGVARIGGEIYDVTATKTSPLYRGCAMEVDAMVNRAFPLTAAAADGTALTFAGIYRGAGIDCIVTVDRNDLPDDSQLTITEMQTALAINQSAPPDDNAWRMWLLVGSAISGGTLGIMFDSDHRRGAAGFFDPVLPDNQRISASARNRKIGDISAAFLRTLVHEAGHAFNLFHPKDDVHIIPKGTTIMNQVADIIGFATSTRPFPDNATFGFDDHSGTSLIHSPDPQVAPGWKEFGWGHGSLVRGITEPVDAIGLLRNDPEAGDLTLELLLPEVAFRGEFVTGSFRVTNTGSEPRTISAALNLSQGDLRLWLKSPAEELSDVRDVIHACGDRQTTTLEPGGTLIGNAQVFYTSSGLTFRQSGRYVVSAEFKVGDEIGAVVKSAPVTLIVRAPSTPEEEEIAALTMNDGVGNAFAIGDCGMDSETRRKLEQLAKNYGHTQTGAAAALTLANSLNRNVRDIFSGKVLRETDTGMAQMHFDATSGQVSADTLVRLVTAVAAPAEPDAPVLDQTMDYLEQGETGAAEAGTESLDELGAAADEAAGDSPAERLRQVRRTFARRVVREENL